MANTPAVRQSPKSTARAKGAARASAAKFDLGAQLQSPTTALSSAIGRFNALKPMTGRSFQISTAPASLSRADVLRQISGRLKSTDKEIDAAFGQIEGNSALGAFTEHLAYTAKDAADSASSSAQAKAITQAFGAVSTAAARQFSAAGNLTHIELADHFRGSGPSSDYAATEYLVLMGREPNGSWRTLTAVNDSF